MTLIGLHGVARAGKDTIAEHLVNNYGFTRVALADAVRDAVYTLNPLIIPPGSYENQGYYMRLQTAVDTHGWDEVKATPEGRRLLQVMGTEVGRNMFGETVWLDIAAAKIDAVMGPVVVTDIRFANELDWLKTWFSSKAFKVTRPGYGPVNAHASDAGLEDKLFKDVIKNDGTLEELYAKVDKYVVGNG